MAKATNPIRTLAGGFLGVVAAGAGALLGGGLFIASYAITGQYGLNSTPFPLHKPGQVTVLALEALTLLFLATFFIAP